MFELSEQQTAAATAIKTWFTKRKENPKETSQSFFLAGYAGTGKTSIAKKLVEQLFPQEELAPEDSEIHDELDENSDLDNSPYRYVAFTGKASLVLSRKGCAPSSTIHSLIYRVHENPITRAITFSRRNKLPSTLKLILPDECSMINDEMYNDLLHFNTSMLFLGDPGQLPPIDGSGPFVNRKPDFLLTEVHRQAAESPILVAATAARENRSLIDLKLPNTEASSVILQRSSPTWAQLLVYDQVLCGTNKMRSMLNTSMRIAQGFTIGSTPEDLPQPGEKLICTRNNWKVPGLVNGSMWKVLSCEQVPTEHIRFQNKFSGKSESVTIANRLKLKLESWDAKELFPEIEVLSHKSFFNKNLSPPKHQAEWSGLTELDYGYAISVHKAQGSEWSDVFLFNESRVFRDSSAKWLYTAITRASRNLTIYQ